MHKKAPYRKIVEGAKGLRYELIGENDWISRRIEIFGEFDPNIIIQAESLLNRSSGCILDIGANMGSFSIPLANRFKERTFHAFEVQERVYRQLVKNTRLNKLDNIECYSFGLADSERDVKTILPDYPKENNIGAFSLVPEVRRRRRYTKGQPGICHLRTLDSLKIRNIALIKIDVEGMELEVIKGGLQTIEESQFPPILFEAWEKAWYKASKTELFTLLQKMGYKIHSSEDDHLAYRIQSNR